MLLAAGKAGISLLHVETKWGDSWGMLRLLRLKKSIKPASSKSKYIILSLAYGCIWSQMHIVTTLQVGETSRSILISEASSGFAWMWCFWSCRIGGAHRFRWHLCVEGAARDLQEILWNSRNSYNPGLASLVEICQFHVSSSTLWYIPFSATPLDMFETCCVSNVSSHLRYTPYN